MIALSTDSLKGYGISRIFEFIKEAGFDGVDLAVDPKEYDTFDTTYLKKLIEKHNLPIVSIQLPSNTSAKKIQKTVEMAKKLGTKIIIIQPPKLLNFKFTNWLRKEVPKIRQKEKISIALENAPNKLFLGFLPEHAMNNLLELKKFKHACLDTARLATKNEDLLRTYKVLQKYLVHIHVSNFNKGRPYTLPKEGALPLESLLTRLKEDDYKGSVSFKINPKFLKAGKDEEVMDRLAEIKEFYEKYFLKKK